MFHSKKLSLSSGIALAISLVVGAGLMALPGLALILGGPITSVMGWSAAILLALPLIVVFLSLAVRFPTSDGLPFFARVAAGNWAGYAAVFLLIGTAIVGFPAMISVVATYFQTFFSLPAVGARYISILILAVATYMNLTGVRRVTYVSMAASAALLAMVCMIIGSNWEFAIDGTRLLRAGWSTADWSSIPQIWKVAALVFWGFVGWEQLTLAISDYSVKQFRPIFLISFALVAGLYLMLAATVTGAAMFSPIPLGDTALFNLTRQSWLEPVFVLVMSAVMVANLLIWMRTTSRLVSDSSRKRILPSFLELTDQPNVPQVAILVLAMCYSVVIALLELKIVTVSNLVLLANQNLMILYVFVLVAYYKTSTSRLRYYILACASVSLAFFLSGFGIGLLYPIGLMSAAYAWYRHRQAQLPKWIWDESHREASVYFELKPTSKSEMPSQADSSNF